MIKNIVVFAAVGAVAGLLLAEFFPDLGMREGEKFFAGVGRAFGAEKPYLKDASIGAAIGAIIGFFNRK